MYIELSVVGMNHDDLLHKVPESFYMFDLEDLFEHVVDEELMVERVETRVRALARIMGVEVDYVQLEAVEMAGHDLLGHYDDAINQVGDYAKLWNWVEEVNEWDYLPIFARVADHGFKYTNADNLNRELENFFQAFDEGDYESLAVEMVDNGLIEAPGEEWDSYVDWHEKGVDIAEGYTDYTLDGVTYLFTE